MAKAEEYIRGDHFLFKTKVILNNEITVDKFLLRFEKQFEMKAGHVVAVSINEEIEPRIYSICCGEDDNHLQILFDLKEEGELTPKLKMLKEGDTIYVSKPYGSFMPTTDQPMWWIATGTGIAPFYAMFNSNYSCEKLLHGAREKSQFYFEKELRIHLKDKYVQCCSTPNGVGDFSGRVTDYLESETNLPTDNKYYLCGRALMVVEVRDILISKGIPYENIISEIFF